MGVSLSETVPTVAKLKTPLTGVYKITHTPTGQTYVGRSTDLAPRWSDHKYRLRQGNNNAKLQALYDADGKIDDFEFEVVEFCHLDVLAERYHYHAKELQPGLNIPKAKTAIPTSQ